MLKLVSRSNAKPVTLELFKKHARVVDDDENENLQIYLDAATEFVADRCQLVLAPEVWRVERGSFWSGCFQILIAPVRDIASVKYYDTSGVLQTVDEDRYGWRRTPEGATLEFLPGFNVPEILSRDDAVQIEVQAGFEDAAATGSGADPEIALPKKARQAIMLIASHWNEHREAADPAAMHTVPFAAESIMGQLRVWR